MRFKDLFRLACQNLFRRKMRSFLTILGVVIGCTAIVSMMSLGYGLERNMLSSIQDSSELTTISLMGMEGMRDNTKVQLNDSEVEFLEALPGVRRVERIYTVFVRLISGKYETYQEIKCYDDQTLREMGYEIIEGHDLDFDSKASSTPSLLIGKNVLLGFQKPGAHRMYWGGGPDEPESKAPEDLNLLTKNCFIDVQESIFYSPDIQSSFVPPTLKKQIIKVAGIMQRPIPPEKKKEGDVQIYTYDEMNTRICARFEEMKPFLQHYFKGYAIPRQKHTPRAKPAGPISYSELRVRTNSIEDTKRLYKELNELGKYFCSSSVEYLEQMRSQMASVQLFLGGIGFISFFIAAIGIANTMMMSIYERTKEIGIFKVLGCSMRKIRSLFLMESAMIGLIGGILGVALSFLIRSLIINGVQSELFQPYIPPYLPPIAIACSTLIGVIAGFSPARRAMRLSPLKAIHNE